MEWFCNLLIIHNLTQRLPHQTSKLIYSIFPPKKQLMFSGPNKNQNNCIHHKINQHAKKFDKTS